MHKIRGIHPSTKANAATQLQTAQDLPSTQKQPPPPPQTPQKEPKEKKEPIENTGSIHECMKKKKKKRCEKTNPPAPLSQAKI